MTGSQISIGNIHFKPFNQLEISHIYAADLRGDTLLYAETLSAQFDLLKILNNRLLISSIHLDNFNVNVGKDSLNADFNFQFFIEAFASKDTITKEKSNLVIQIDDITLTSGRLSYHIADQMPLDSIFDPNHIQLSDFNTKVSLQSIDIENLDIKLKKLSFKEQSGLIIQNISATLTSERQQLFLSDLALKLPNSNIEIPQANIDYTDLELSQLINSATYKLEINSKIYLPDLQALYGPLKSLDETLSLNSAIEGKLPSIKISQLDASVEKALHIRTKASIYDYTQWNNTAIYVYIDELSFNPSQSFGLYQTLTGTPLPDLLQNMGNTRLTASIYGFLPQMQVKASLDSQLGKIQLDGTAGYNLSGKQIPFDLTLDVPEFNLYTLMQDSIFGNVKLQLKAQGNINEQNTNATAHIELDRFIYNQYSYSNIAANISYQHDSININVVSNDSNALLTLDGLYRLPSDKQQAMGQVSAHIDQLALHKLHLLPQSQEININTIIQGAIQGNSLDEYTGYLNMDSLAISSEKGLFRQNRIELKLDNRDTGEKDISLKSDLINALITGKYSLETLPSSISNTIHQLLPAFVPYQESPKNSTNQIELYASINDMESLSGILDLPFLIKKPGIIQASYTDTDSIAALHLEAMFPSLHINSIALKDTYLSLEKPGNEESLSGIFKSQQSGKDTLNIQCSISVGNDSISANLYAENKRIPMQIPLVLGAKFDKNEKGQNPDIRIKIYPADIQYQDQVFTMHEANLSMIGDTYTVENFMLIQPDNGNIRINGIASANPEDSLKLNFEQLNLAPLADLAHFSQAKIGAVIDGGIVLRRVFTSPLLITDNLTIKDIAINKKQIGNIDVKSAWSERRKGLMLDVTLHQENQHKSRINGFVMPAADSLSVNVDVQAIHLDWFEPFMLGFLDNTQGDLGAKITATGKLSKPTLSGYAFLNDAAFHVKMNNVSYSISDSVYISPEDINFQRFQIKDQNNNIASISGKVKHNNFQTYDVNLNLQTRNFLLLNNPNQRDSLFFGTLTAIADASIRGSEKGLNINASIKRGTQGRIFVQMPESEIRASQYENIVYINTEVDSLSKEQKKALNAPPKVALPIRLVVDAEVTPSLQLGAIINPGTQDAATVTGNGNIRLEYNMENNDMKLLGNYVIEDGKGIISLKNITKKEFVVQKGSTVTFSGDPLATSFNITAVYSLKADLTTLDSGFSSDMFLTNPRVKTNCIINVTGNLNNMQITYNIEVPDTDESIRRKVANIIHSDDMKIKQVAYLLALGSFFPPEGNMENTDRANIWTHLASSTLSSQLNNLLSGVLKENWTVGTSLRSNNDSFSDVEMDVNVSTRLLNDRLTVSTNLGYKNSTATNNNITGDFYAEYKLTHSGNLSLKAYNITNDAYYRQNLMTQGIGVVYKKESKTFKELFRQSIRRFFRRNRNTDHTKDAPTQNQNASHTEDK